jgi:hypothetical protein
MPDPEHAGLPGIARSVGIGGIERAGTKIPTGGRPANKPDRLFAISYGPARRHDRSERIDPAAAAGGDQRAAGCPS